MQHIIAIGEKLEQLFAHGWGFVLLAFATLIGGIAAIDYFYEEPLKKAIRKLRLRRKGNSNSVVITHENPVPSSSMPPLGDNEALKSIPPRRLVLLYKHDTSLDESAVNFLETLLTQAGHQVFIDRDKNFEQLRAELIQAEAVIILLTAASVYSDMLEYEVETAAQTVNNRAVPKLLLIPLYLQFTGPLPQANLAKLLDNRPVIHWPHLHDTSRLSQELMQRLTNTPPEMPYGAMPIDSQFYVKRQQDSKLQQAIAGRHSTILLRGPRQVGKTSLLVRGLQMARDAGMQVWFTNLQTLGDSAFENIETFYSTLAQDLATQAQVDLSPDFTKDSKLMPNQQFENYFCNQLLPKMTQPVLWAIDEADRLLQQSFSSDVFGLLRTWHDKRATQPNQLTARITLLIAYATEYHLFIKDPSQSPFNVGTKLTLEDFTVEQVTDLNQRYDSPLHPKELHRFHRLIGGHPYLARRGLHEMVHDQLPLKVFTQQATQENGIFSDHLRRMVTLLDRDPALCEALRTILRGQPCPNDAVFDRLRSGGVLRGESRNDVQLRCELYATYLKKRLL